MIIARIDKMQSVWTVRLHPTSERIGCFSITVTVGAIYNPQNEAFRLFRTNRIIS